MSENTNGVETTTPPATVKAVKEKRKMTEVDKAAMVNFTSLEEAKASPPDNPDYKIYQVARPDGSVAFTWNEGALFANRRVAENDGYRAVLAEGASRVSPEKLVEQMSEDKINEILEARGLKVVKAKPKKTKDEATHAVEAVA